VCPACAIIARETTGNTAFIRSRSSSRRPSADQPQRNSRFLVGEVSLGAEVYDLGEIVVAKRGGGRLEIGKVELGVESDETAQCRHVSPPPIEAPAWPVDLWPERTSSCQPICNCSPRRSRRSPAVEAGGALCQPAVSKIRPTEGSAMPASDQHTHDHLHASELSEMQLRVRALETILTEKGYVDPAALDQIVENFETRIGPHIGARVVARAWIDPEFKRRLLADASEAVNSVAWSDLAAHLIAVENTPEVHNVVVCTLCSCYPWSVLGLPPVWYKSAPYRSRTVIDPTGVLAEFGLKLPPGTAIRIWDSTAETRFLVVPMRPTGTDGWSEEALASLVTRDSMVGTGLPKSPESEKAELAR
jgi:nitrile hydratase subunit alpha